MIGMLIAILLLILYSKTTPVANAFSKRMRLDRYEAVHYVDLDDL
jgi:hypothetical protein